MPFRSRAISGLVAEEIQPGASSITPYGFGFLRDCGKSSLEKRMEIVMFGRFKTAMGGEQHNHARLAASQVAATGARVF